MQRPDIDNINVQVYSDDLFEIVGYYFTVMRINDVAYGNGFDRKGKAYMVDLCRYYPDFAVWFGKHYPNTWAVLCKQYKFETKWSQELADSMNVLLGYRAA